MALEWVKHNRGYASTKCGRFQMSLASTSKGPRYSVFAATTDPMNPLTCFGAFSEAEQARNACEEYLKGQREHERLPT